MAQSGKKSDNFKILSEIYNDRPEKKESIVQGISRYFSDPKKVDLWLARAILFIGFFGIVFGAFHFKNQIFSPYVYKPVNLNQNQLTVDGLSEDLLGLSQKDTDQDGISDFDELKVYNTSPYLSDSDSDGLTDLEEIAGGSDPICPKGVNCFAFSDLQAGDQPVPTQVDPSALLGGNLSADQIRQLLLQSGTSADVVNSLTDQEVLSVYQEVLAESAGVGTGIGSTGINISAEDLANLTPDQVRQLLIDRGGISEADLDLISDQELMQFVQDTLKGF